MYSVIEDTLEQRKDFIDYCSKHMGKGMLIHVKQYFSDFNKAILLGTSDISCKAYPLYRNVQRFFEDFADDVTEYGILYTLYICAAELGISTQIQSAFVDCIIPEEDEGVDKLDTFDLFQLDFGAQSNIIKQVYGDATEEDRVIYCGLHTLNLLNYLEVQKDE